METKDEDKGLHQNIARATAVIDALAEAGSAGLRLTDVMQATDLSKATAHRTMAGLTAHGWADHEESSGRYFLGMKLLSWASTASDRFGIARIAEPSLLRLCQSTQDTVYLHLLVGDVVVCLARLEGAFPIKALTLRVGDRRPLGVGAGSLALLAAFPDEEVDRVLAAQTDIRSGFLFDELKLRQMIRETRTRGYAFNDVHIFPGMEAVHGMAGVGLPVRRQDGYPICAISVAAITPRMESPRRENVVASIRAEVARIEVELRDAFSSPSVTRLLQQRDA